MQLPNAASAAIADEKITAYLLNAMHPQNKGKAAFYTGVGYSPANAGELKSALLGIARTGVVTRTTPNVEGTKYVVVGTLIAPNGKRYELRTVWIIEHETPRLVTAYPN